MIDSVSIFFLFLKASFLSFGGLGSLPILHQDLIARGAGEAIFGRALAVGRLSPGPNGLYVVSLGYQLAGIGGALEAALALLIPPFCIIAIVAWYSRVAHLKRTDNALKMLSLAVAGSLGWTSWQIVAGSSTDVLQWASAGAAMLITSRGRTHPLFVLVAAGVLGVLVYR